MLRGDFYFIKSTVLIEIFRPLKSLIIFIPIGNRAYGDFFCLKISHQLTCGYNNIVTEPIRICV